MEDGSNDIREAGAEALGTLMKVVGEKGVALIMDKINDKIKEAKVREYFENAQVKIIAKGRPAAVSSQTAPAATRRVQGVMSLAPTKVGSFNSITLYIL
jgi:cytoskeleton-associated protein 5